MRGITSTAALAILLTLFPASAVFAAPGVGTKKAPPAEAAKGGKTGEDNGADKLLLGIAALITAILGGVAGLMTARAAMKGYQKSDTAAFTEALKLALTDEKESVAVWRLLDERLMTASRVDASLRLLLTNPSQAAGVWELVTNHLYSNKRPELIQAVLFELYTNPERVASLRQLLGSSLTNMTAQLPADPKKADLAEVKEVVRTAIEVAEPEIP